MVVTEFMDFTRDHIHNRLFPECEILDNFRGLCGPRTRTRTWNLVLTDKEFHRGLQYWPRPTSELVPITPQLCHTVTPFTVVIKAHEHTCKRREAPLSCRVRACHYKRAQRAEARGSQGRERGRVLGEVQRSSLPTRGSRSVVSSANVVPGHRELLGHFIAWNT